MIEVESGTIVSADSNRVASITDIVKAAEGKPFLFLGESHTNLDHHKFQAQVIQALEQSGRSVVVGFEMFTRPVQDELDPWTMGWWTEDQFVKNSDWKHQWGYDFSLYRPIFEVTRRDHIPMVALNIPRAWVHAVASEGFGALSPDERTQLPGDVGTLNPIHKQVFEAMIGGHPGGDTGHMYDAQVLWDEAMADSALKYLAAHPQPSNSIFVVVCGSGHVMYGQGINWRIAHRTGMRGTTVIMIDDDAPAQVSRGLGDFIYRKGTEQRG